MDEEFGWLTDQELYPEELPPEEELDPNSAASANRRRELVALLGNGPMPTGPMPAPGPVPAPAPAMYHAPENLPPKEPSKPLPKFVPPPPPQRPVQPAIRPGTPSPTPQGTGAQPAKVSEALLNWVAKKEGFDPKPFSDYGQVNIGHGTSANGRTSITREEARAEMAAELQKHMAEINKMNPRLPQGVKDALASLSFNTGGSWYQKGSTNPDGTPNLRGLIEAGNLKGAMERFKQYNKAGGSVLGGLMNRRNEEANMFTDPGYIGSGKGKTSVQDWGGKEEGPPQTGAAGVAGATEFANAARRIIQNQKGSVRNMPINEQLTNILARASAATGLTPVIYSGGQPQFGPHRTGSHRHDLGGAGDLKLRDENGRILNMTNPADQKRMAEFVTHAVRAGATGVGAAVDYMGPESLHIGGGTAATWGAKGAGSGAPQWLRDAYAAGQTGQTTSTPDADPTQPTGDPTQPGVTHTTIINQPPAEQPPAPAQQAQPLGGASDFNALSPPIPQLQTPPTLLQSLIDLKPQTLGSGASAPTPQPPASQPTEPPETIDLLKQLTGHMARFADAQAANKPIDATPDEADLFRYIGSSVRDHLRDEYGVPDLTSPSNWTWDTGQKLIRAGMDAVRGTKHGVQGLGAGAGQFVIGAGPALGAQILQAGYTMTNANPLYEGAKFLEDLQPGIAKFTRGAVGLDESDRGVMSQLGESVGRASVGGPVLRTLSAAGEFAGPTVLEYINDHWEPHVPTLDALAPITSAQAQVLQEAGANVEAKPDGTYVIHAPGGDLTADQRMMRSKGILGILGFGAGLAAPKIIHSANAKLKGSSFEKLYGDRSVPGLANSKEMMKSTLWDYARANLLSPEDALTSIYDRAYTDLMKNAQSGLNPATAAEVSRTLKLYDHSGQQNLISAALEGGKMETPTLRWGSDTTIPDLVQYAKHYPQFDEYIRLKVYEEQLQDAANARLGPLTPARLAELDRTKPLSHAGTDPNVRTDMQTTRARLQYLEQTTPDIVKAAEGYKEIIREGRRFNTEGQYGVENAQTAMTEHLGHDYTPWYNIETSTRNALWQEARVQDVNMIHMLERTTSEMMANRMKNEWKWTYEQGLPQGTLLRPVDPDTIKSLRIPEDFLLKMRRDGVTHTFAADSMVATGMKLDPYGLKDPAMKGLNLFKSGFTKTTTGPFAPAFAFTAAGRAYLQHLVTTDKGFSPVGPFGLVVEAINQAGLKVTTPFKPVFDAGIEHFKNSRVGQMLPPEVATTIGRILTFETTRLFNEQYNQAGGRNKTWSIAGDHERVMVSQRKALRQARAQAQNPQQHGMLQMLMDTITTAPSRMWRGDPVFRNAVHNATRGPLGRPIEAMVGRAPKNPLSEAWSGWKDAFKGVADITQSAYARKHAPQETLLGRQKPGTIDPVTGQPVTMADMVAITRNLMGDPANRGHGMWQDAQGTPRGLAFHAGTVAPGDSLLHRLNVMARSGAASTIKATGMTADVGHATIPWAGTLIRSPAKTISAMATNPGRAVPFMIATQMIPAMAIWRWNQLVSPDHADYGLNRRSEYDTNQTIYVARPDHPPQQGWTFPNFQEANPFFRGTQLALDQLFGNSPHSWEEDFNLFGAGAFGSFWKGVAETNLIPPWPSPFAAYTAVKGGVDYGQGMQERAKHPYKQYNQDPSTFETVTRALFGSIGDYVLAYYNAAHAAEEGTVDEITSGAKDVGKLMGKRAPFVREVIGFKPQVAAQTRISNEIHEYDKTINELSKFYTFNVKYPGSIITAPNYKIAPQAERAAQFTGDRETGTALPPGQLLNPGLAQPGPVPSPAYHAAMIEMENLFKRDDPSGDLAGYKVMFSMYGKYSAAINNLRNVNTGDNRIWLDDEKYRDKEEARIMSEKGINPRDHDEVLGYYLDQRNRLSKQILSYIKAAEEKIDNLPEVRQSLGPDKHFTIKDADPYSDKFSPGWKWKGNDPTKGLPEGSPLRTEEGKAQQEAEYKALQERLNAEQAIKDAEVAKRKAEERAAKSKAKAAGSKASSAEAKAKSAAAKAQSDSHRAEADGHRTTVEQQKMEQMKAKAQEEIRKTIIMNNLKQMGAPGQLPFNPF